MKRTPLVDISVISRLPDDELAAVAETALARLSRRQATFVRLYAAGERIVSAAKKAGYSSAERMAYKVVRGIGVTEAIALLREVANRGSGLTVEDCRRGFRAIYSKALTSDDLTNANRALEQLAKLAGLYPEQKFKLEVSAGPSDLSKFSAEDWELLARFEHEVRPKALPPAIPVEAIPVPEEAPDAA